jgi:hypothetical protein
MARFYKISITLLLVLILTGGFDLHAQAVVHGDSQQNDSITPSNNYGVATPVQQDMQKELFKPNVSVSLGSSFSTFGSGYNTFGTYIAPEISMPVSKKFSVSFGMGYSNMFFNAPAESGIQGYNSSYGNLFVSGTYQVNEKLIVRGTAYKTFMLSPPTTLKPINPQMIDFSSQGVRFDAEYKVSNHFKVGVSIEYREQNYPSFYDFNSNGLNNFGGSPFGNPSFGRGY